MYADEIESVNPRLVGGAMDVDSDVAPAIPTGPRNGTTAGRGGRGGGRGVRGGDAQPSSLLARFGAKTHGQNGGGGSLLARLG